GVALVLIAVAVTASAAYAGNQVKGGHYTGKLKPAAPYVRPTITFDVSANGTHVLHLKLSTPPSFCGYGRYDAREQKPKPAPISNAGTFAETLRWVYNGKTSS